MIRITVAGFLVLLALSAAAAPVAILFNADDDNRDGVRDHEGPAFEGDDDRVPAATPPGSTAPWRIESDAPDGAVRLAAGAKPLVEALRPRDANWDGRFTVTVTAEDGATAQTTFRVSPLLVRSSTAPAETVFVREFSGRNDQLVEQLTSATQAAGAELHVVPAGEPYAYNHIWLQDCVEFLTTTDGERSITVALAANRDRAIDLLARDRLLGPGVGYLRVGAYRDDFARGEGGVSWIDWYGNLEASPPTPAYPSGRVLYGVDRERDAQLHPEVVAFLAAQEEQPPLAVDVGWLTIRHADEMIAFLPATDGGFLVAVPDPTVALAVLRRLADDGHAAASMLGVFEEGTTVASVLEDTEFVAANERLWTERIEPMADELLAGIGVEASRLARLPVLFQPSGLPRTPNVVNCLVLPGAAGRAGVVAMADPNGPVIDGVDVLQQETRRRLRGVAAEIRFVDDRQYHKWSGNVHCATNAIREP